MRLVLKIDLVLVFGSLLITRYCAMPVTIRFLFFLILLFPWTRWHMLVFCRLKVKLEQT